MPWTFNNNEPIYIQLVEALKLRIISGQVLAGSKLPSVRELAEEAEVNPNTMQRALAELEREGLVFSQRTSGRFVTEDIKHIKSLRTTYGMKKIEVLVKALMQLGYTKMEISQLVETYLRDS